MIFHAALIIRYLMKNSKIQHCWKREIGSEHTHTQKRRKMRKEKVQHEDKSGNNEREIAYK